MEPRTWKFSLLIKSKKECERKMKKIFVILVCLLMIATVFGATFTVLAGKGGGGKPPKDDPPDEPPVDPAITYIPSVDDNIPLKVMNEDGTHQTEILMGDIQQPTWAPDGSAIAFLVDINGISESELWRVDVTIVDGEPQGSNPTLLYSPAYWSPSWSADGDVIAFIERAYDSVTESNGAILLRTIPATGGEATTIYTAPGGYRINDPTWSTDELRIAWVEKDASIAYPDYSASIMIMDLATSTVTTAYGPVDQYIFHLDWARTGDVFAFTDGVDLYKIDLTQSTPTPEFIIGENVIGASWSPDDNKIAFSKPRPKGRVTWQVNIYDFDTGEVTVLANGRHPDWKR
jgi:Tol biopolymer transport system component